MARCVCKSVDVADELSGAGGESSRCVGESTGNAVKQHSFELSEMKRGFTKSPKT
jgi:hypothetical protein